MKKRILQICTSILLLFAAVQCGRDIYARYAEFLNRGRIVPSFILICGILLIGTLFTAVLIWKSAWLRPLYRIRRKSGVLSRLAADVICLVQRAVPGAVDPCISLRILHHPCRVVP